MLWKLSLIIIDEDPSSRRETERVVLSCGGNISLLGSSSDFAEGATLAAGAAGPTVVILSVSELEPGMNQVSRLLAANPHIALFIIAEERSHEWILRFFRAGVAEYLLKPLNQPEIAEALGRIDRGKGAQPMEQARGKIISVYNPSGGMGTTTVAVNLAASLAQRCDKVALVDLNSFSGDVATFLDVSPRYTLSSVTANIKRLDPNFLMGVMFRHSSGVHVLSDPHDIEESGSFVPDQIVRILELLQVLFTHVVVDAGGHVSGVNRALFQRSDAILFTTVLTLPALKNAKRYLPLLAREVLSREQIKIVVNRHSSKWDIKLGDAEKVLNLKVFQTIPNDFTSVNSSINKGIPLVNLMPQSPVSTAIANLTGLIAAG